MPTKRLTAIFLALMLAGSIVAIVVPAGARWDFANFYDAGRRVAAGESQNLYESRTLIGGQPPQGTTGFFGAPISAWLYVPLGQLPVPAALVAFKIQNVLALGGLFAVLFLFYRRFAPAGAQDPWAFAALFAGLCLAFQPFWTIFRVGGQTTPTAALLVAIALVCHVRERLWWAAACLIGAAIIKPAFGLVLVFLTVISGVAFLWRVAVAGTAAGLVSIAIAGWPLHQSFLDFMRQGTQWIYPWTYNSSVYVWIESVRSWLWPAAEAGVNPPVFEAATVVLQFVLGAALFALALASRRAPMTLGARRHFEFLLAIFFFLFWSRTIWEHYLMLLFVPLLFIVSNRHRLPAIVVSYATVILVLCAFQNLILINWIESVVDDSSLGALLALSLFKSGPLLLMAVILGLHWRALLRAHAHAPFPATTAAAR